VKTDGIREGCGFEKLENTKMKAIEKWGRAIRTERRSLAKNI